MSIKSIRKKNTYTEVFRTFVVKIVDYGNKYKSKRYSKI
jgi:hypothetical protein